MSDKRASIIKLHRANKTNSETIKLLKTPKSTVYHTVNRSKELNTTEDRPQSGGSRTSCTPKIINAVRERIRRNSKRPMRKMPREIDVREKTMRNIVKTDLKFSPSKCKLATTSQTSKKKSRSSKNSSEQNEVRYCNRKDTFLR